MCFVLWRTERKHFLLSENLQIRFDDFLVGKRYYSLLIQNDILSQSILPVFTIFRLTNRC